MKTKIPVVLIVAAALALAAVHLRVPYGTQTWRMESSAVQKRTGETMSVSMPRGDVDVNRATQEELQKLPGIGPVLAGEIIAEREKNGAFYYPEDLLNVKGIGEKSLEKMLEQFKLP